jgi:hypothetical protein
MAQPDQRELIMLTHPILTATAKAQSIPPATALFNMMLALGGQAQEHA